MVAPIAVRWVRWQERKILRYGVPLTRAEVADAQMAGVMHPERVRLLVVDALPWPCASRLAWLYDAIGLEVHATCGLTLGYGIFVRRDCWRERPLIAHELVHVAQYERLGGISQFLRPYLTDCLTAGYFNCAFETEARRVAERLCPAPKWG